MALSRGAEEAQEAGEEAQEAGEAAATRSASSADPSSPAFSMCSQPWATGATLRSPRCRRAPCPSSAQCSSPPASGARSEATGVRPIARCPRCGGLVPVPWCGGAHATAGRAPACGDRTGESGRNRRHGARGASGTGPGAVRPYAGPGRRKGARDRAAARGARAKSEKPTAGRKTPVRGP